MSEVDIAWAAGLFEGEGCVFAKPDKGRIRIITSLDSCDQEIVDRFASIVGVGKVFGPYEHKKGTRPYWKWRTTGPTRVMEVFVQLKPYLGARRTHAFRSAFTTHSSQPPAYQRRSGESNPGDGLCRPAPNHSATAPEKEPDSNA